MPERYDPDSPDQADMATAYPNRRNITAPRMVLTAAK
jgi:hypothetical protein